MKHLIAIALAAASAALPAVAAEQVRAVNHQRVVIDTSGAEPRLTVLGPTELWARDYWCAAGDIAFRRLGYGTTDRLQVTRAYRPGAQTVEFGPGGSPAGGVVVLGNTVRNEGASLSVGQARSYCADRILRVSR